MSANTWFDDEYPHHACGAVIRVQHCVGHTAVTLMGIPRDPYKIYGLPVVRFDLRRWRRDFRNRHLPASIKKSVLGLWYRGSNNRIIYREPSQVPVAFDGDTGEYELKCVLPPTTKVETWGYVTSCHGPFEIDRDGLVIGEKTRIDDDTAVMFDIREYKWFYRTQFPASSFDILDLGLWFRRPNGTLGYDGPSKDWRVGYTEEIVSDSLEKARDDGRTRQQMIEFLDSI